MLDNKLVFKFSALGLLIGLYSFWLGWGEVSYAINLPVSELYNGFYNHALLPYWETTQEPIDYEYIPITDLKTGTRTGVLVNAVYDIPGISDLYRWIVVPASVFVWGFIGVTLSLVFPVFHTRREDGLSG
jgi:hypothetical protein